ncbi:MAG: heavy metal-binding domain-containing protein [Shewanella psychromarinicola]|uniref:heavy metal-binding domain-containing protein n=1 Tax=Shewanella psychromarinicola TaxID=2487742 RepID=UPI003002B35F
MTKECLNCGYISVDELQEELSQCPHCDVFYHKVDARVQKITNDKNISFEQYYESTKDLRNLKYQEAKLRKDEKEISRENFENETIKARAINSIKKQQEIDDLPEDAIIKAIKSIIITTTDSIPFYITKSVAGIIFVESSLDIEKVSTLVDNLNNNEMNDIISIMGRARYDALDKLRIEAIKINANAVIKVKLEHLTIPINNKNHIFIIASGTAVEIEKIDKLIYENPHSDEFTNIDINNFNSKTINKSNIRTIADSVYLAEMTGMLNSQDQDIDDSFG